MQRINRTVQAPLGTAFFLFLAVAIIPVSLRVAGVTMTLSPRLAAAIEAWNQIAPALGASYQQAAVPETAPASVEQEPVRSTDSECTRSAIACTREPEPSIDQCPAGTQASLRNSEAARSECPRAASRPAPMARRVEIKISAAAAAVADDETERGFEQVGAMKLERLTRRSLVKGIEAEKFWKGFEQTAIIENFSLPLSLKLGRAPVSAGKTAECKVRAAMSSARRLERVRARLIELPPAVPDNSEL